MPHRMKIEHLKGQEQNFELPGNDRYSTEVT